MKENKLEMQGKALQKLVKNDGMSFKTSAGMGEDTAGAGGNLTFLEILRDILSATYLEGSLYDLTWKVNVSDKANGILLPIVAQTTRSTVHGILGGVITYDITEGTDITLTYPKFNQTSLALNQIGVAARVTNALVQDSTVLPQFLRKGFENALRMKLDRSILYGDGATNMYGIMGSTAIGTRATKKMTLASPMTVTNIRDMVANYYGGDKGIWVMAHDAWHEILNLHSSSTYPTFPLKFYEDQDGRTKAKLFGYEVMVNDAMDSRDICIGDFTAYVVAQKPLREDVSEHLYFTSNENLFRSIVRVNGAPLWNTPIQEQSGDINYCFVVCHSGDAESSSSSSESSSSSSSYWKNWSSSSKSSVSSNSSSSSSNNKSESSSSSSIIVEGCKNVYCASSFTDADLNGEYTFSGQIYNNKGVYTNDGGSSSEDSTVYMWYQSVLGYWAISLVVGNPQSEWLATKSTVAGCPYGAWSLSGVIVEGACS